jgi:hypothetical protein
LRIASELGWVNVDAMLDELTPRQFMEWVAYFQWMDEPEPKQTDRVSADSPDLLVAMKRKFRGR